MEDRLLCHSELQHETSLLSNDFHQELLPGRQHFTLELSSLPLDASPSSIAIILMINIHNRENNTCYLEL